MGVLTDAIFPNYEQDQSDLKFIRKISHQKLLLILNSEKFKKFSEDIRNLICLNTRLDAKKDYISIEPYSGFLADTFLNYSFKGNKNVFNPQTATEIFENARAIYSREPELEIYFYLKIEEILNEFGLPYFYLDSIQHMVLYGLVPDWEISFPIDFLIQIIEQPILVLNLDLSTYEKKFITRFARHSYGIKGGGRIRNKKYLLLLTNLKYSKNILKGYRNLERDFEISKKLEEKDEYYENDKFISKIKTSKDVAVEVDQSDDNKILNRKANNVRKIKQRTKTRLKKI